MSQDAKDIWQLYNSSWKVTSIAEKRALFEKCLERRCEYNDPLIKTKGWDELEAYMLDFHRQFPGAYFVTTYFLAHSGKSIAKWEMRGGDNSVLSDGISYAEYNKNGKLVSMTGFFEPNPA